MVAYRQHQVTLVQRVRPCDTGEDLLRVQTGDLGKLLRNVLSVNVDGVQGGEAVGELGGLGGRLDGESLDGDSEVGSGRHGGSFVLQKRRGGKRRAPGI